MAGVPRILKWSLVALGLGIPVAAGGVVWRIHREADRCWAVLEATADRLTVDLKGRSFARPPLRGEPLPGDAADDYQAATDEAEKIDGDLLKKAESNRTVMADLVARHRPALDAMQRGARRTNGPAYVWREDYADVRSFSVDRLFRLAIGQADFLEEAGKFREAAELMLDASVMARDLEHQEFGRMAVTLPPLGRLLDSRHASRTDLEGVERQLDRLEGLLHRTSDFSSMTLLWYCRSCLHSHGDLAAIPSLGLENSFSNTWRHGFSVRLIEGAALGPIRAWFNRLKDADDLPFERQRDLLEELFVSMVNDPNPIVRVAPFEIFDFTTSDLRARIYSVAALRVLRAAAHYRATGEALDLPDPYVVGRIHSRLTGSHLKIWSVGENGRDDGGSAKHPLSGMMMDEGDIVLEVDR